MTTADQELQRKLDALKTNFIANLAVRLNEIEAAMARLDFGTPLAAQTGSVQTVLEQSHKIAGSAGTFGFGRMSAIASETERLCEDILKGRHGADAAAREMLNDKIAALRAEAPA